MKKIALSLAVGLIATSHAFAGSDPAADFVLLAAKSGKHVRCEAISEPRSKNPEKIEYQLFFGAQDVTLLVYEDRTARDWYRYSPNTSFERSGGAQNGGTSEADQYDLTDRGTLIDLDYDGVPSLIAVDSKTHQVQLCDLTP
jgi:hypothetical protein